MSSKDIRKMMDVLVESTAIEPAKPSMLKELNEGILGTKDTVLTAYNFAANQLVPQFGFEEHFKPSQFVRVLSPEYYIAFSGSSYMASLFLFNRTDFKIVDRVHFHGKQGRIIDFNDQKVRSQVLNKITEWIKKFNHADPVVDESIIDESSTSSIRGMDLDAVLWHIFKYGEQYGATSRSSFYGKAQNMITQMLEIYGETVERSGTGATLDEAEMYKLGVTVLTRSMNFSTPEEYAAVKQIKWPYGVKVRYDDNSREVTWKTAKMATVAKLLEKAIDFGASSAIDILDLPSELAGHARHGDGYVTPHARRNHRGA